MWIVSRGHEAGCKVWKQRIPPKWSRGHWRPGKDQGFQGKGNVADARPTSKPFVWHNPLEMVRNPLEMVRNPLEMVHLSTGFPVDLYKYRCVRGNFRGAQQLILTCCEVFLEDARVLDRLLALFLYCSDPQSPPPLSLHWKSEESNALPIPWRFTEP